MLKKSIATALLVVMVAWAEMALAPMFLMHAGHVHAAHEMSEHRAAHHHVMPAGHPCCPGLGNPRIRLCLCLLPAACLARISIAAASGKGHRAYLHPRVRRTQTFARDCPGGDCRTQPALMQSRTFLRLLRCAWSSTEPAWNGFPGLDSFLVFIKPFHAAVRLAAHLNCSHN